MFRLSDGFKFCLNPAWVANMFFTLWKGKGGGGGGSAQPTQSTSYTTNIPEYAKPYVENMLNATQAQIYNDSMTGFNPYVPYSTDPRNYVASFSPLQSYAQSGAAGLTLPANYGLATGQTLGTGAQLGMLAPQMGMAGANYGALATSPSAINAYMNPYLRSSLAPQLEEARRQYDITGAQEQAAATRAGAFGGSREALMAAENRRNMAQQMNQMIGQGYNQAFNQAQQAQQFGANLGLQGQQAQAGALAQQLAAANQLAGLGGQQLQAQQGIYNLQNQFGQQQQQQQQNIINQAIQNYATAQQYPFMQLGVLNSMLRGLPMQQSSTQMYQAPPSTISQLAGLGTAGLGALGMYNAATQQKTGGLTEVKKMAGGGTAVPMKSFNDTQLNQVSMNPRSDLMDRLYAQEILQDRQYLQSNPEASSLIAQALRTPAPMPQQGGMPSPQQMAMAPQSRAGIDNIGTGDMVQMAGGGLLAFVGGGDVPKAAPKVKPAAPAKQDDSINFMDEIRSWMKQPQEGATAKAQREAIQQQMNERTRLAGPEALTRFGLKMMAGSSPYAMANIGNAGADALDYYAKQMGLNDADKKLLLQQAVEAEKAEDARRAQLIGYGIQAETARSNKLIGLRGLELQAEANKLSKENALKEAAAKTYSGLVADQANKIRKNLEDQGLPIEEGSVQLQAHKNARMAVKGTYIEKMMPDLPELDTLPASTVSTKTISFGQLPKGK